MFGDCWAESVEGQGSTFYLLVLVDRDTSSEPPSRSYHQPGSLQRAVIYASKTPATSVLQANLDSFGVRHTVCDRQSPHTQQLELTDFVIMDVDDYPSPDETLMELKKRHRDSKASSFRLVASFSKAYICCAHSSSFWSLSLTWTEWLD
jgi:hypothetical protein